MKLTTPTTLSLSVDPSKYLHAPQNRDSLWYLLNRLFSGQEIAEAELKAWGITIEDEFVSIPRMD